MRGLNGWLLAPERQAFAWAFLGVTGLALAGAGLVFLLTSSEDSDPLPVSPPTSTPTPVPSPTGSRTATPPASATPSAHAQATPTAPTPVTPAPAPATRAPSPTIAPTSPPQPTAPPRPQAPTATATSSPTATPSAAATSAPPPTVLAYCTARPGTGPFVLAGIIEIGGQPAPPGTSIAILFDGLLGPAGEVVVADVSGYTVRFAVDSDPSCANRPGATISLLVSGAAIATGLTVPPRSANALIRHDVSIP